MGIMHKVDDVVRCVRSSGYRLTTGKEYTVVDVLDSVTEDWFTYPSYVVVRGDDGNECVCHHHRFTPWNQE